tara:strand:- start:6178 stop:6567 length:390 start_codon:yes stop_codon:yes gene_type:complete
MEHTTNYLGLAGIVSLDKDDTIKYNQLLKKIGTEGMLIQFERFLNDGMLSDLIAQVEDNLLENNVLFDTDYVIYDKANDNPLMDSYGRVLLFGNPDEAFNDLYGNEIVIPCTQLPKHWQEIIMTQIKTN